MSNRCCHDDSGLRQTPLWLYYRVITLTLFIRGCLREMDSIGKCHQSWGTHTTQILSEI